MTASPSTVIADYTNVSVKYLGTLTLPPHSPEREAISRLLLERDKAKRHQARTSFLNKHLLVSLLASQGLFRAQQRGGGQCLNIALDSITSLAVIGSKFAFVVTEPNGPALLYAFQFRNKVDCEPFLAALEKATAVVPDTTTETAIQSTGPTASQSGSRRQQQPSTSVRIRQRSNEDVPVRTAGPVASNQSPVQQQNQELAMARLRDTVAELNTKLGEARLQSAKHEADLLTCQVEKSVAERDAALARKELETIRKEMALAAAEMSAELAAMKSELSGEQANTIMNELQLIKQGLAAMDKNSIPLWKRVDSQTSKEKRGSVHSVNGGGSTRGSAEKGIAQAAGSSSEGPVGRRRSASTRLLGLMQRASMVALMEDAPTHGAAKDAGALDNLSPDQLRVLVQQQQQELRDLRASRQQVEELQKELQNATRRNAELQTKIDRLNQNMSEVQFEHEMEKRLLADTIAGLRGNDNKPRPISTGTELQPPATKPTAADVAGGNKTGSSVKMHTAAAVVGGDSRTNVKRQPSELHRVLQAVESGMSSTASIEPKAVTALKAQANMPKSSSGHLEAQELVLHINFDKGNKGLGFSIAGGLDDCIEEGDPSIYVTNILSNHAAAEDGRLRVHDRLIEVNGNSLESVTHDEAVRLLQAVGNKVQLVVGRLPEDDDDTQEVEMDVSFKRNARGLGFSIAGGSDHPVEEGDPSIYVTAVVPGGAAEVDGHLLVGDRIISVNGVSLVEATHNEAVAALQAVKEECSMRVGRISAAYSAVEEPQASQPADNAANVNEQARTAAASEQQNNRQTSNTDNTPEAAVEDVMEIELEKYNGSFGLTISGGVDDPLTEGDDSIYIIGLVEDGAAARDGRLRVKDRILEINGQSMTGARHEDAVRAVQAAGDKVKLVLSRPITSGEIMIEVELQKGTGGLGFSIAGGTDDPSVPGDPAIYIVQITPDGTADRDGRLRKGDRIVKVNDVSVESVVHERAVELLLQNPERVKLLVSRLPEGALANTMRFEKNVLVIEFLKPEGEGLGFSIAGGVDDPVEVGDPGIFISEIIRGGPASRDGRLQFGDELIEVNGVSLDSVTHQDAVDVLRACSGMVRFKVVRIPANSMSDVAEFILETEVERKEKGLGFSIAGGLDDPVDENDPSIYITNIIKGGAAEEKGVLRVGDKIISINGESVVSVNHTQAVDLLLKGKRVQLKISRMAGEADLGDNTAEA